MIHFLVSQTPMQKFAPYDKVTGMLTLTSKFGTISEALSWGQEQLTKHEIPHPKLESQILLAYVLKTSRETLIVNMTNTLSLDQEIIFKVLIKRRCKFEPVAYLTQQKEFMSLSFYVSPDVLIPRPETEILVEEVISRAQHLRNPITMLDIGTGSGCIAVSCAKYIENIKICATDISKSAIEIAKINAQNHHVENKIDFYTGSLFDVIPENFKKTGFDFIASNPPYIERSEIQKLQKDISKFEPKKALDGGIDGLKIIRKIILQSPLYLKNNGVLILEIGYNQGEQVSEFLKKDPRYRKESILIKKDYGDLDRIAIANKI